MKDSSPVTPPGAPNKKAMFSIGAFAILFNERGWVLLCHRRDMDLWNLPGGAVESGELPTDAAIREVQEETGLKVAIERLVGVYGKADKNELVFAFTCRIIGGQLSVTEETSECRYFGMEEIPLNTSPKHVERIRDALYPEEPPVFRRQTGPSSREMLLQLPSHI